MKKDILFLCQYFYPEFVSSATLPFDTAVALREAGFSVDALCGYPQEYVENNKLPLKETVRGIGIHRVRYLQLDRSGFLGRLINYFSLTFMMMLHFFEIGRYRKVIVYSNPPILPWVASWAKLFFGTELIFVAYDLYPEIAIQTNTLREGNMICQVMEHINKCVYRRADRVVALSEEMKSYICKNRPIDPDRVVVIPNWYADKASNLGSKEDNPFYRVTQGRFVVSYFGNMGTAQDMQTILETVKLLKSDPGICFLFAGHGNKLPLVKQMLDQEKIENAYVYDFLKGQDFQNALQISNCALISLAEGLTGLCVPSKTYSYMMQGLPLLAIMDESDIVRDVQAGAGAWVRNGQSKELAEYICKMSQDPEAVKAMATTCRKLFLEKYSTTICTDHYVKMMQEL